MGTSSFNHGFEHGVSIRKIPLVFTNAAGANTWWVDSVSGSDNNSGTEKEPFATINYASSRCTANNGDVIMVAPGHVESVVEAGGLTLSVAGVKIIFLGDGSSQGTIQFGTAVTASMVISANNVKLYSPRFSAAIDALTGPISITGENCKIYNATYLDGTSIDTTDALIATASGLEIHGWRYIPGDEAGTQKQSNIQLNGVDNAILEDIDIVGDFATGPIENVTDEVLNVRLENILIKNTNATPAPGIVLDADATGWAKNVDIRVASGITYVSSTAKLNWDAKCVGYNADGGASVGPIGI